MIKSLRGVSLYRHVRGGKCVNYRNYTVMDIHQDLQEVKYNILVFNPDDDSRTLKSVCVNCHTSRPLWTLLPRSCC